MKKRKTKTAYTNAELEQMCFTYQRQTYLDSANIHNKLGQPERQSNETLNNYEKRLRSAQFIKGYAENDWIWDM